MSEHSDPHATEQTDLTGLNLFDERASAVGSFPHGMWGYDRQAVDGYVRDLEKQVATLRQLTRTQRSELKRLAAQPPSDMNQLGNYATAMLRNAEGQAADLIAKAGVEAERIKEEGRRVAADLRSGAQTEADDLKITAMNGLRQAREDFDRDAKAALDAAKAEADQITAAAHQQAEMTISQAKAEAEMLRQAADAELRANQDAAGQQIIELRTAADDEIAALRKAAEEEIAKLRASADVEINRLNTDAQAAAAKLQEDAQRDAAELAEAANTAANEVRADAAAEAKRVRDEANAEADRLRTELTELLSDTKRQHEEVLAHVAEQHELAAQTRSTALADAEQIRSQASATAEEQIAASHRQSAMMRARLEEQFAWRKEQLQREVELLLQRKDAIVAELASLQAFGLQSAADLPNDDPFDELELPDQAWLAEGRSEALNANEEQTRVLSREELDSLSDES